MYAGLSTISTPLVLVEILLPFFSYWPNEEENVVWKVQQEAVEVKPKLAQDWFCLIAYFSRLFS